MGFLLLLMAHQNSRRRPGRDRDAFAAVVAALTATGEFADVFLQNSTDAATGAGRDPLAIVSPVEWRESPDAASGAVIRSVTYTLTLIVRDPDPRARFEALDRLSGVVQNTLEGAALGAFCMASMSRLRHGRFDAGSRHPELRLVLDGEFGYAISAADGRNVAR